MLRPNNYLDTLNKYENGCIKGKDCYQCPAFTKKFKTCVFDDIKLWQKWARDRHTKYQEFVKEQNKYESNDKI